MLKPNPGLPTPDLRAAMIVTKAPSEPWEVVERTLLAMLDQDYPYPYDTWLADERPTGEVRQWCAAHGVRVSSREGIEDYHRAQWPRRTRCKEGNLAYFYDKVGYEAYDVVAQFDSDHEPSRSYLREIVAPFRDPRVGYVAAPSICDSNARAGWTVRGRLWREATMHGPAQAGCNDGWAPVCIGSHYAVRTRALRAVGGLGPELAEDYSTTLALLSGGWSGAFAIDAIAHGAGPETVDDMLVQEVQWARSLGAISTGVLPHQIGALAWRARLRMVFALVCYPMQAAVCVVGTCLPTVGVLTRTSWGAASFADFYVRLWTCSMLMLLAVGLLRRSATLRPVDARMWSVDVVLFQLVRWPWTAYGFARGMFSGRQPTARPFRITPKTAGRREVRLGLRPLAPLVALTLAPLSVVIIARPVASTMGLYVLLIGQTVLYAVALIAVVALHFLAKRRRAQEASADLDETDSPWDAIMAMIRESGTREVEGRGAMTTTAGQFTVVRQGWDPAEVSAALDALRAERDTLRAAAEAASRIPEPAPSVDATASDVFSHFGEQVAGILRAAEESAARILDGANADVAAVREEADERLRKAEQESQALLDDAARTVASAREDAHLILSHARERAETFRQEALAEAARLHSAALHIQGQLRAALHSAGHAVENLSALAPDGEATVVAEVAAEE
jgi:cellulose synthase/poly-beta-1,6-N-acetylglucosamine synthase-like glycosyltransferase